MARMTLSMYRKLSRRLSEWIGSNRAPNTRIPPLYIVMLVAQSEADDHWQPRLEDTSLRGHVIQTAIRIAHRRGYLP